MSLGAWNNVMPLYQSAGLVTKAMKVLHMFGAAQHKGICSLRSAQIGQPNVLFSLSFQDRSPKVDWLVVEAGQVHDSAACRPILFPTT
jgi:hypothetical protein